MRDGPRVGGYVSLARYRTINDTRWTEAINKCGLYQLQTLRDRHVKTDRQASTVWFVFQATLTRKQIDGDLWGDFNVGNFHQHNFSPHSPSHCLCPCLFVYFSLMPHWPVFKLHLPLTISFSILSRLFNRYCSVIPRFTATYTCEDCL
jgi:hypothetical protein